MSGDVADLEDFGMPPEETRADIEKHVRRLAPPAEFLQRGKELIGTPGRGGLRWPGQRSYCKVVGRASVDQVLRVRGDGWKRTETRAIVASRFVEEQGLVSPRRGWRTWRGRINFLTRADRSAGAARAVATS